MSTIEEILTQVTHIGSDAVALTDHGTVAGHLEFYNKAIKTNVKPIFGMEAYHAKDSRFNHHKGESIGKSRPKGDTSHLIILAKDNVGLKNLWTLSSRAHTEGFYYRPRVDWELLEEHKNGLIVTSACLGGKVAQAIMEEEDPISEVDKYLEIFGDDFYIEIHTYDSDTQKDVNIELVSLATKKGIPLVYATDAHYACEDQYVAHEAMMTIASKKTISDEALISHPPSLWIRGEEDIRKALSYLPKSAVDEAIRNSELIADMCEAVPPGKAKRIPKFAADSSSLFVETLFKGYDEKVKHLDESGVYIERLEKEVNVILNADLQDFFLIQWDIMNWARENDVATGPGRGSVGGSLVAYLLGITDIDPIRYDLIFERFYNAGREKGGLPDIDTDFPTNKRDDVKAYLASKYGEKCVSNIGTALKLHGKSAIERVGKFLEIDRGDINKIKEIIESTTDAGLMASWEYIMGEPDLYEWKEKYPDLFKLAGDLHGRIFTYGQHASGFLIGNEELEGLCPLKYAKGEISTQFDMHDVESLGFMKQDLLGLRNIDILEEARSVVLSNTGEDWDYRPLHHLSDDELRNKSWWHLLDKGLTVGLFQVEDGKAARWIAQRMKCRTVEDLSVIVALNRPGPLRATDEDSGKSFVELYLDRREGADWDYLDPFLSDILDKTHGVFVYQEQVIRFFQKLGFSEEEADNVRRIMGKKKPEEMAALYPQYMEAATKHMPTVASQKIWRQLEGFAMYAFNKAHSIGYGIILLWTLATKAEYPAEYLLACMKIDADDAPRYIAEALRMGITVHPPDINKSHFESAIIEGDIYYGLKDVKGVQKGAEWVVENRPFTSFDQMVELLDTQNKEFLALKKKGEIDGASPKQRMGAGKVKALYNVGAFDALEEREVSKKQKLAYEKELLGIILSDDSPLVLQKNKEIIDEYCISYEQLAQFQAQRGDGNIYLPGSISSKREATTKKGNPMAWVKMQYEENLIEFAVFSEQLAKHYDILEECTPVIALLRVNSRGLSLVNIMELS